jgi:hypothetical protein
MWAAGASSSERAASQEQPNCSAVVQPAEVGPLELLDGLYYKLPA